jgi:hypothetical protein
VETRFTISPEMSLSAAAVQQCYMQGLEGIPWTTQNSLADGQLVIRREGDDEIGSLSVPWSLPQLGTLTLTTASLAARDQPYPLLVELARGTIHRLRQYIANSRPDGVPVPDRVSGLVAAATRLLGSAVTSASDPQQREQQATDSLMKSLEAIEDLACWDAEALMKMRILQQLTSTALIGFRLDTPEQAGSQDVDFFPTANICHLPICWNQCQPEPGPLKLEGVIDQLEWARGREMRVMAGPLLRLDDEHLPAWLDCAAESFQQLQAATRDHIEQLVERLHDKVDIWHATAGLNRPHDRKFSEEQRLRLTVDAVETIRRHDRHTPVVVSFDQPWGEYLAHQQQDLSPIHFAETLVRANLGISGIGLEINWQFSDSTTQPRDLLAVANQLDRWSQLQLPLAILFKAPTASDGFVNSEAKLGSAHSIDQLLQVMLGRPNVQAIVWQQLEDRESSSDAACGLRDSQQRAKRMLTTLEQLAGPLTSTPADESPAESD